MSLADINEEHKRLWKEFWEGLVYLPDQCCEQACVVVGAETIGRRGRGMHNLPFDPATLLDWIDRLRGSAVNSIQDFHAADEKVTDLSQQNEAMRSQIDQLKEDLEDVRSVLRSVVSLARSMQSIDAAFREVEEMLDEDSDREQQHG